MYIRAEPVFGRFPIIAGGEFGADRSWVGYPSPPTHTGVDHATPIGTPVPAMLAGTVVRAGWSDNFSGYVVKVQADDGSSVLHAHLDRVSVQAGDRVERDQLVAHSGNTGSATTGPHLHTEYRDPAGAFRDPLTALGGKMTREEYAEQVEPFVKETIRVMLAEDGASRESVGSVTKDRIDKLERRFGVHGHNTSGPTP